MRSRLLGLGIAAAAMVFGATANAGAIFEIRGNGSAAPFATSLSWGSVTTGGGAMTGRITLKDSFVLPTVGSPVTFGAGDIAELSYSHTQTPTGGAIDPVSSFSFSAGMADITSAFGEITTSDGIDFFINKSSLEIITSVVQTQAGQIVPNPIQLWTGNRFVRGTISGINDTEASPLAPLTGEIVLTENSLQSGFWIKTGDTVSQIPEPATLVIVGFGFAGLAFARRRRVTS